MCARVLLVLLFVVVGVPGGALQQVGWGLGVRPGVCVWGVGGGGLWSLLGACVGALFGGSAGVFVRWWVGSILTAPGSSRNAAGATPSFQRRALAPAYLSASHTCHTRPAPAPCAPARYGLLDSDDEQEGESEGELEGFGVRRGAAAGAAAAAAEGDRHQRQRHGRGQQAQRAQREAQQQQEEDEGYEFVEEMELAPQESKPPQRSAA